MGATFMGMLQDKTLKPLAKTDAYEEVAMDAYGVLGCEAPSHIQWIETA